MLHTQRRTRSGSSPAASTCTARRRSRPWPSTPTGSPPALDEAPAIPVRVVVKPVLTGRRRDPPAVPGGRTPSATCVGLITWMHTFSPAKMWIAGLGGAAEAVPPPAHAVQPRDPVGDDRHGLHEPEPVRPRRPRVRVHRRAAAAGAQGRRRPLGRRRRPGADRRLDPGRVRPTRLGDRPDRPLRRQHARGRGHRGRQGRGPAAARLQRQRLRRRRPRRSTSTRRRMPTSTPSSRPTSTSTTSSRSCARAATAPTSLRDGARIEIGLRAFLGRTARSSRSPTRSRISTASTSCRASPSSG